MVALSNKWRDEPACGAIDGDVNVVVSGRAGRQAMNELHVLT
jgi:hypothetical protein